MEYKYLQTTNEWRALGGGGALSERQIITTPGKLDIQTSRVLELDNDGILFISTPSLITNGRPSLQINGIDRSLPLYTQPFLLCLDEANSRERKEL